MLPKRRERQPVGRRAPPQRRSLDDRRDALSIRVLAQGSEPVNVPVPYAPARRDLWVERWFAESRSAFGRSAKRRGPLH